MTPRRGSVDCGDFTADNGATRLVQGSHQWPQDRVATEGEIVGAVMPRGSAVVWLGSVLHGMGITRSDRPRTGVVSGFCVGWLHQEENQYLATPPEVAATLPHDVVTDVWKKVLEQDGRLIANVQRNMDRPGDAGIRPRFSPFWECNVQRFQQSVVDALRAAEH